MVPSDAGHDRASTARQAAAYPRGPAGPRPRSPAPGVSRTGGPAVADAQDPQPAGAAEALERLGGLSLRELSMDSLLHTVADLTKTVMPGNPEASVLLLVKDRPTTVVSTGSLATELDETQYEKGHGPCLHAARTGEVTEIPTPAPMTGGPTTRRARSNAATSARCPSRWRSTSRRRSPAR